MPKSCCVPGCTASRSWKYPGHQFYVFPKEQVRRNKWLTVINRTVVKKKNAANTDGKAWSPNKSTFICSAHFLTGKKNNDPCHPDYVPSVFSTIHVRIGEELDLNERRKRSGLSVVSTPLWNMSHPNWTSAGNMYIASRNSMSPVRNPEGSVCVVSSCNTARNKESWAQKTFYALPSFYERRKRWLLCSGRKDLVDKPFAVLRSKNFVLCSDHFNEKQFVHNCEEKRLIYNAAPSVFAELQDWSENDDDAVDDSCGGDSVEVVPVLKRGCLWPSVDHTYCLQNLKKKKKRIAIDKNKLKRRKKSGQPGKKGRISERKADRSPKVSNGCTGKPGLPVTLKGPEKKQRCCAAGCHANCGKTAKTLYDFPVHKTRCIEWLQNLGREDLLEKSPLALRSEGYRVCTDHFEAHHITTVGHREQLTRSAVPALLKHVNRQTRKSKPAEKTLPKAKSRRRGPAQDPDDPAPLQFKVEIDRAEDPALHYSTQVLSGFPEDQVELPNATLSDPTAALDTDVMKDMWDNDQSALPVCVTDIKTEPESEDGGETHCQSLQRRNHENDIYYEIGNIKSEPGTEEGKEPHWNKSLHYDNCDNKTEPGMENTASIHRNKSPHDEETSIRTKPHTDSVKESLRNRMFQYENGDAETELENDGWAQRFCCQPPHSVDSNEFFGNNLELTMCKPEDDDVDMPYIVVKPEQESDIEDV